MPPRTDRPAGATAPRIAVSLGAATFDSSGSTASRLSALVRASVGCGIVHFDLTEATEPVRCWELAAAAAGAHWADSTVFVPEGPALDPERADEPQPRRVVRCVDGTAALRGAPSSPNTILGVRFRDLTRAEIGVDRALREGAGWVVVPGHLLDARRVRGVVELARASGAEVLLTNPHAEGRLDGRWLAEGTLANDGPPRPMGLPELQRAYSPLLPLGFLTEGHRRTLAQAAVAFVQAIGAVPSVRVRDPRQLEELSGAESFPPLSAEELARLESHVPGAETPAGPMPPPGFK